MAQLDPRFFFLLLIYLALPKNSNTLLTLIFLRFKVTISTKFNTQMLITSSTIQTLQTYRNILQTFNVIRVVQ
jgi:hypothetical protein